MFKRDPRLLFLALQPDPKLLGLALQPYLFKLRSNKFNIIINIKNIIINIKNIIICIIDIIIIINKFEKKILLTLKNNHGFDLNGKIKNYYYYYDH
jgi:hypothetical protein